ncbi:hypothetical protein DFH05DRAFT_333817 [Lentinula detonsa]|uniref:Uncharacterized protein n=1 Tax=Lentinula detonsa TaxID=2804962 RepID=A0A9W8TUR6_9AGAR|nr:hypothetical protein DFH05DRAFT_333817 [Lentinula detonsa]KAJ3988097.1 hypothetical protein F5890DRAFT_574073 [Lentinula detonsa]
MSSSSATRLRREEDVEKAYAIQVQAGLEGAARFTAVGLGLSIVAHHTWPAFRHQGRPFKAFLLSMFCVAGVVFGAERALIAHEAQRRLEENHMRRIARLELTKHGIIPTETEIAKWRLSNEQSH